jgi:hypothetical protein
MIRPSSHLLASGVFAAMALCAAVLVHAVPDFSSFLKSAAG